ncbi:hypothetical protein BX600DRAFT_551876 [Xylariales sp. PMI_506]|nr:hypothetical protein BX600DRAFT_551876 [Xylariales sp. PMI_506]
MLASSGLNAVKIMSLVTFLAFNAFITPIAAFPLSTPLAPTIKSNGSEFAFYFGSVSKRDVKVNSCSSTQEANIKTAWTEVQNIISSTVTRTNNLYTFLSNGPASLPTDKVLLSTLRTFEALLGQVFFGADTASNKAGLGRVSSILSLATAIQSAQNDQSKYNLGIYCDDYWLSETDTEGDVNMADANSLKYFNTITEQWIETSNFGGSCRDNPNLNAWALPGITVASTGVVGDIITLCQDKWDTWNADYANGETITASAAQTNLAGSAMLGLVQSVLSITLLHELTHSANFLGANGNILVDQTCDHGETAYGFICVNMLAMSNPSAAIQNADSFALYSAAMYLSKYDWSTGIAESL